ncbi:hypothetical protein [Amycolatopsis eburnea]|uniref:Antibiotic biosynthesis monooxygenase n=1 Tax=Amycolatopsis eburnea TaxID=2267691 RepID=A0A427T8P8_9PSEU|nr:hypothetical protein [Amycolatopsis eburnea]RSD17168.1 hypothetical protein EIY87_20510 [Amycolatopsis eburnea]
MYLAAYHFEGNATELLPAYDKLLAAFPPEQILLHACVTRAGGITVFDACPTEADFTAFSTDPGFAAAIADAGLPPARVEPLGEVHAAHGSRTVPS